jgi:long-chain acyl-CoA synthetase
VLAQIASHLEALEGAAVETLGSARSVSYRELCSAIKGLREALDERARASGLTQLHVGLFLDNSPEWIAADLALLFGGHVEIPVPIGFTVEQCRSLLDHADLCLVDAAHADAPEIAFIPRERRMVIDFDVLAERGASASSALLVPSPAGDIDVIVKAVHTSGTTAMPKGVLVGRRALESKVRMLTSLIGPAAGRRYLSLVPMSLLLEQISAIYFPLCSGGTVVILPRQEAALTGGGNAASHYLPYLRQAKPTFLTVPPSVVLALRQYAEANDLRDEALHRALFGSDEPPLIACGGAAVPADALTALQRRGLPVCEGYGLSENTSVVTWNLPTAMKIGTVGRALPDCELQIAEDGEVLVRSTTLFSGYLGHDPGACELLPNGFLKTGDIGAIDEDGYLRILGRKKNIIINTSGRKISAEWVEGMFDGTPCIRQAFVYGDGETFPVALLFVQGEETTDAAILAAIRAANEKLPDYARVRNYHVARVPDAELAKYVTITGRPRRDEARRDMCPHLDRLFAQAHPQL